MTQKKKYTAPRSQALMLFPQSVLAESATFKPSSSENVDESDKSNNRIWSGDSWGEE